MPDFLDGLSMNIEQTNLDKGYSSQGHLEINPRMTD